MSSRKLVGTVTFQFEFTPETLFQSIVWPVHTTRTWESRTIFGFMLQRPSFHPGRRIYDRATFIFRWHSFMTPTCSICSLLFALIHAGFPFLLRYSRQTLRSVLVLKLIYWSLLGHIEIAVWSIRVTEAAVNNRRVTMLRYKWKHAFPNKKLNVTSLSCLESGICSIACNNVRQRYSCRVVYL